MAATRVMGSLVAAAAVLSALCACLGASDASTTGPPAVVTETPDVAAPPAPAVAVPAVPRRSSALEDNQPVVPPAPSRIEIGDLGIDVAVQPVGLDEQGRMGLFDDPSIAAWYQWGPAPASTAGSMVIAAHVDSLEYDLLPFARLKDAVAGTQIFVTDAAGTRHPYLVQSVRVIEKADVDWVAAFDRAGPPRLTLVTCGGEFDYENRRYLSNLVLTAIPAG
jgi:LPXTG-site transpeptidase (sortase) family protein